MKSQMLKVLLGLFFIMSCSKSEDILEFSPALEERGNDNHKIFKLAQVNKQYTYLLTDGSPGVGNRQINYVYSCSRPVGRAVGFSDRLEENGEVYWENSSTMSYNDNFMISEERAQEYGDEVVRTYQYDSDYKWTGITTEINGELIEDELIIGPGGQVQSYSSNGVRFEYTWRANNAAQIRIYVETAAELRSVQNSLVFNRLGMNDPSRKKTKEMILKRFKELQKTDRKSASFRGRPDNEWVLIGIEEQKFDLKVIEPFSSPAKGYPGTTSDGGYYYLSKNFTVSYRAFLVNEDGSPIKEYYYFKCDSYKVKNNLPVIVHYSYFESDYAADEEGNALDYNEKGTIEYSYISGCNQSAEPTIGLPGGRSQE